MPLKGLWFMLEHKRSIDILVTEIVSLEGVNYRKKTCMLVASTRGRLNIRG